MIAVLMMVGAGLPSASAQTTRSVAGRVVDRVTAQPISGARVFLHATTNSRATDRDGRYELRFVPTGPVRLRAIAPGYASEVATLPAGASTLIDIDFFLTPTAVSLDDIVVTAVGDELRRSVGHDIASIDATSIVERRAITNTSDLLRSRAAGVFVMPNSGVTGTSSRIRIRGSNSMLLSNEPLVYVDGIRVESGTGFSINALGQAFSRIHDIDPDHVASVDIVKGPSAATLYGTEASNGVIRFTTKRGQPGHTRWNIFAEYGSLSTPSAFPSNYEGIDGTGDTCDLVQQAAGTCEQTTILTFNPLRNAATSPIGRGLRAQFGADVSGGSEAVQYFLAANWESEQGVLRLPAGAEDTLRAQRATLPDELIRPNTLAGLTVRTHVRAQVVETAEMGVSAAFRSADTRIPNGANVLDQVLVSGLTGWAREERNAGWRFSRPEELFEVRTSQAVERFTGSFEGNWRPFRFLSARAVFGYDETTLTDILFQPAGFGPPDSFTRERSGRREANRGEIVQTTVDLSTSAGFPVSRRVSSRTSIGMQYFRNSSNVIQTAGREIVPGSESISGAAVTTSGEVTGEIRTFGMYIEHQVALNDRLYLTAAIRGDDSNTFGRDFDVALYPKLSASWVVSDEPFFPGGTVGHIRLRAAWGAAGRQPGPTAAVRTLAPVPAVVDGRLVSAVTVDGAGNVGLRPERSREIEAGLDVVAFDGRVGLSFTAYHKSTRDALVRRALPPSLGVGAFRQDNIGRVDNSGFEVTLRTEVLRQRPVSWFLEAAGAVNHNTVRELCAADPRSGPCENLDPFGPAAFQRFVEGFPPGGYWDRPLLGFDDANNDGFIAPDEMIVGDTAVFLGTPFPTRQAALSTDVTFLNTIRIGGLVDYQGGHHRYGATERQRCAFLSCRGWHDRTAPRAEQVRAVSVAHPSRTAAPFVQDASSVTLRELSMTLSAPGSWRSVLGARRLAVTVSGRNLARWTPFAGVDPEANSSERNRFSTDDFGAFPQVRYVIVRLDMGF